MQELVTDDYEFSFDNIFFHKLLYLEFYLYSGRKGMWYEKNWMRFLEITLLHTCHTFTWIDVCVAFVSFAQVRLCLDKPLLSCNICLFIIQLHPIIFLSLISRWLTYHWVLSVMKNTANSLIFDPVCFLIILFYFCWCYSYVEETITVISSCDRYQDRTSKPSLKLFLGREWVNWLVLQDNSGHFIWLCELLHLFWL